MFNYLLPVFADVLNDLKNESVNESANNGVLDMTHSNPDGSVEQFNWNNLYYYLSLAGLHNKTPFQDNFPSGSAEFLLFNFYLNIGVNMLTKTQF